MGYSFVSRCNVLLGQGFVLCNIYTLRVERDSVLQYWWVCMIYRGYYTVARRCEFYVRVPRTISHSFAALTREILFLTREHKIHIFEPTCNVLFIIWRQNIEQKQQAGIVTSLNDTTLSKVTYGKYATRVPDEVAYGIYEWFSSQ